MGENEAAVAELTIDERTALLAPCECGHSINDHGSTVACWSCEDEAEKCRTDFEALLVARVGEMVAARVTEALNVPETRVEASRSDERGPRRVPGRLEGQ